MSGRKVWQAKVLAEHPELRPAAEREQLAPAARMRPAESDLDWARRVPLDRINSLSSAKLMIRFLREELDRADNLKKL